jgi:SAM-dependent methyltransferase
MADESASIVAAGYDALVDRYADWAAGTTDLARDRLLAEFMDRLRDGSRVLDVGCGSGLPSTRVLAEHYSVTGLDISARQLSEARRNVPTATFIRADIATVQFDTGSFDGITAFYALAHVPRRLHAEVLQRIGSWLTPGGLFLATLGAGDSPDWIGEWLGQRMFFSSHPPDVNRELIRAAGLSPIVDEVSPTLEPEGAVPFHWVLAVRDEKSG